jgi:hypothetical protein
VCVCSTNHLSFIRRGPSTKSPYEHMRLGLSIKQGVSGRTCAEQFRIPNFQIRKFCTVDVLLGSCKFATEQERQGTFKRNIEARSRNHCCREEAICIIYSERVNEHCDVSFQDPRSTVTCNSQSVYTLRCNDARMLNSTRLEWTLDT